MLGLFLSLLAPLAFAEVTQEFRLDKTPAMEKIPVMNQADTNICASYATAQMIDAYRFSHGDKNFDHISSPVRTAAGGATLERREQGARRRSMEFMWPWSAVRYARQNGTCPHDRVMKLFNGLTPR